MTQMTARYDLQCPKSRCAEPVIECRNGHGAPFFVCKLHGQIAPLPKLGSQTSATGAPAPRGESA